MSSDFWVKLISAFVLFALGVVAIQLYKSELVRDLRARFLRRKIVPLVQALLPMVAQQISAAQSDEINQNHGQYEFMGYRADLEALYAQAKPLFDQERETIRGFLERLSALSVQLDHGEVDRILHENTVLLGQRVIQELTEIGI